jgi:hypothetical protein
MDFQGLANPLSDAAMSVASNTLDVNSAAIWTVIAVETSGCGFLSDRRPKILFERHIFHDATSGEFDVDAPDLSNSTPGGYGASGAYQYDRLARAIKLNKIAALSSTSWGLGQVLGMNAKIAGFNGAEAMVNAMVQSEDSHLSAMVGFIQHSRLDAALRNSSWSEFAAGYNGPNYRKNQYDDKLRTNFERLSKGPLPDLQVRAAQILLTYLGLDPGPIDGILGSASRAALNSAGAPTTTTIDDSTLNFLRGKLATPSP